MCKDRFIQSTQDVYHRNHKTNINLLNATMLAKYFRYG